MKKSILILFTSCTFLFSSAQEENKFKVSLQAGIPETTIGQQFIPYYQSYEKTDLSVNASELGIVGSYNVNNINYRFRLSFQSHSVVSENTEEYDGFDYINKIETEYNYYVFAPGISKSIQFDKLSLELGIETSLKIRPEFSTEYTLSDTEYDYYSDDYVFYTENYSDEYDSQLELAGGGIFGIDYSLHQNLGFGIEYAPSLSQRTLNRTSKNFLGFYGESDYRNRSTYVDHRLSLSIRASF